MRVRRCIIVGGLVMAAVVGWTPSAQAACSSNACWNVGDHLVYLSQQVTLRGVRDEIDTPGNNFTIPTGEWGWIGVGAEAVTGNSDTQIGYALIGFAQTHSNGIADCGDKSVIWTIWRARTLGETTNECGWIGQVGSTVTHVTYASVRRAAGSCGSCTIYTWAMKLGSTIAHSDDLLFGAASDVFVGGMISPAEPSAASLEGCFGCANGSIPWQRTSVASPGSGDWTDVTQQSDSRNDFLEWHLGPVVAPDDLYHPA